MDEKSFRVAYRDNVGYEFEWAYFSTEYGGIFWYFYSWWLLQKKERFQKERRPIANKELLYQLSFLPYILLHGVTVRCIFLCFVKVEQLLNADPQTAQENLFSSLCVCMCLFKLATYENDDPQTSQENGFSPVCVRMWLCKWDTRENADPQTSHEYVLIPVCVWMWRFKEKQFENTDSQR